MLELLKEKTSIWNRLLLEQRPIVLYGMGNGADKILDVCEKYGIPVKGVFASDGFVRGHDYRGFPVKKLSDLESELGELVVLLSFATSRPEVLAQIEQVAARHTMLAPDLPVAGDILFTREYLESQAGKAAQAYSLLADDLSRQVFRDILDYKISGKISYLQQCQSPKEAVFKTFFTLSDHESFVDAGAYNGDTVEEFLRCVDYRYNCIHAMEPDKRNFKKLRAAAESWKLPHIHLHPVGAWDKKDILHFAHRSGRQAALDTQGIPTPVNSVDNLLNGACATYIKYDVEGAEEKALLGSRETIRRFAPKLLVSAYHRSDDLLTLPQLIHSLHPGYRIYLRHHPYIPAWDTNLYAMPSL